MGKSGFNPTATPKAGLGFSAGVFNPPPPPARAAKTTAASFVSISPF